MSAEIYYFSGTGNSLAVARDIAGKLGGKLIPIAVVMNLEKIKPDSDMAGIVFPVYNQGLPYIIKRFVDKLEGLEGKYVFGVCTHGGGPGISIEYLGRIIKHNGGRLSAGFAVNMPYNYITPSLVFKGFFKSFVLREIAVEKQQRLFNEWKNKLENITGFISEERTGLFETKDRAIETMVDLFNLKNTLQKSAWLKVAGFEGHTELPMQECIQLMDCGFKSDDKCNSCSICTRICPVNNIIMVDGRPAWQHRCEQCFACLQWCPREAIQFGNGTSNRKRYHHPDVALKDMILNR